MSSPGQAIGYVAGAAIGFFTGGAGYVALGATIGGMIGGAIDPPKGPNIVGPKLDDLSFQTSTLGAPLARGYGTFPVTGNVIWLEGDQYREVTTTEEQGGKGGGGATVESTKYYATFAVSLLRVTDPNATVSLRRLWLGSNLVYDAGSDNLESIIASNLDEGVNFTFYGGTDDQQPNPRWQADKGINAVSGMPGRCYIVIEDLDLTNKYSNSLAMAQVKAELAITAPVMNMDEDATAHGAGSPVETNVLYPRSVSCVRFLSGLVETTLVRTFDNYTYFYTDGMEVFENELAVRNEFKYFSGSAASAEQGTHFRLTQADRPVVYSIKTGNPTDLMRRLDIFEAGAVRVGEWYPMRDVTSGYGLVEGDEFFIVPERGNGPITRMRGTVYIESSTQIYNTITAGYSENYLFVVDNINSSATNCRVYKVSRDSLAIVQTIEFSAEGRYSTISVISDDMFYVACADELFRVESGVATSLGSWFPGLPFSTSMVAWFKVYSESPPYAAITVEYPHDDDPFDCSKTWIVHAVVPKTGALLSDIIEAECGLAGIAAGDIDTSLLGTRGVDGIVLSGKMTPRSVLETLQPIHPFDVVASGYKLKIVPRGAASVATIDEGDLGAVATGESAAAALAVSREMETQLPARMAVKYLDYDREYDIGEQFAEYPAQSQNQRTVDLPVSMTGLTAVRVADVLLQKDWIERTQYGPFSLPPIFRHLEASDVISVGHRGRVHEIRLTRIEYLADGRLQCSGVASSSQSFVSTAQPQNAAVSGQSLVPLRGSSNLVWLDIPTIIPAQDTPGISFGMYGRASGWPGAIMVRSDDGGLTWASAGSTNDSVRVFDAEGSIGSNSSYTLDLSSRLTVRPRLSAHALYSLSAAQFFAGGNIAAYGVSGRWEIVNFKTVEDNGDGTFTLANFRRGLFGTEQYMTTHASGDLLVMLGSAVGFSPLPLSSLGLARNYRAVTQGSSIDSATDETNTYSGINLKPLSGVKINGSRHPSSLAWTVLWSPRSRSPVELFSGFAVPSGESASAWDVEVWNSGYTALKRTFSGLTSATFSYLQTEQATDFGSAQETLYLKIYQVSSSMGRGSPLVTSITRPLASDPYAHLVTCLMHMDTTGLLDTKGATVTLGGNAARSATQSKFGGYSAIFDGTQDYLQLSAGERFNFGTGDFTIEAFVYISADSATDSFGVRNANVFTVGTAQSNLTSAFMVYGSASTTGTALYYGSGTGSVAQAYTFPSALAKNTWHHVGCCVKAGYLYFFANGSRLGSPIAYPYSSGSNSLVGMIGGLTDATNYRTLNGFIDELRITKGYARYIDNPTYTVPTQAF